MDIVSIIGLVCFIGACFLAAATGAFADANVGTNKAVTISGLALTGTDAANYTLVAPTATASITTALSISLGNLARTYDGAPKPVSVNVSGGTGVTTVTYGGSNVAPTNAGSYSVFASVSGDAGSASTSGTLVIAKATPSLSFSLGETAPQVGVPITLAATASSGLPVTFSVVSGNASLNGATLVLNDNSPVTVRASQAGDGNYNSVSVDRTITSAAPTVCPASDEPPPRGRMGTP